MYAKNATFTVERDGEVIHQTSGGASSGKEFAPFADASNGTLEVPADLLETAPRGFVILGKVDDASNIVAESDVTCIGACTSAPEWTCGPPAAATSRGVMVRYLRLTPTVRKSQV